MKHPLPWPASGIERDVLHELRQEAKRRKMPIAAIVKAAVEQHVNRVASA